MSKKRRRDARRKAELRMRAARTQQRVPADGAAPRHVTAVESRPRPVTAAESGIHDADTKIELAWSAGVAAASAAIFATTLKSHVGLGDAPETVAGVASLGILHPPGYPAYVLSARLFTLLEPFGSMALRVNLFSLICASAMTAGLYLVARRSGAARWAAALGALALAASASLWFYADFAKHNTFSGLVVVTGLILLMRWQNQPTTVRLLAVAAALGVGLGSSWQLTALIAPALAFAMYTERRRYGLGQVFAAGAVGAAVAVALYGFVLIRAGQSPAVNWGEASNLNRLEALINLKAISAGRSGADPAHLATKLGGLPQAIATYSAVFGREMLAALPVAGWGLVVSLRRPNSARTLLLVFFLSNLLGAAVGVGAKRDQGFNTDLFQGGFLLGCFMVLAVWTALGATDLVRRAQATLDRRPSVDRADMVRIASIALLTVALLVPSLAFHRAPATRTALPLADGYATTVLAELPPHAVLFVWAAEAGFPVQYRQVAFGERQDVDVVDLDLLLNGWYRKQLSQRLHRAIPKPTGDILSAATDLVQSMRKDRPAYLDMRAAQTITQSVGYVPIGLVAQVTDGTGPWQIPDLASVANQIDAGERASQLNSDCTQWPNGLICQAFTTARLEVARGYAANKDYANLRVQLIDVLRLDPGNQAARHNLDVLAQQHH